MPKYKIPTSRHDAGGITNNAILINKEWVPTKFFKTRDFEYYYFDLPQWWVDKKSETWIENNLIEDEN